MQDHSSYPDPSAYSPPPTATALPALLSPPQNPISIQPSPSGCRMSSSSSRLRCITCPFRSDLWATD